MIDTAYVIEMQEKLSNLFGCPGRESKVADFIVNEITPFVDDVTVDKLGNVIACKKGSDPDGLNILLDAHMDEVGFIVNHITTDGFLMVASLGGIEAAILPALTVSFETTKNLVTGIFCTVPPHLRSSSEVKQMNDLYIDIGASSYDEVIAMGIHIGSIGTFDTKFRQLNDTTLTGKGFDDRSGCNILIQIIRMLKDSTLKNTLYFTFTIMEEYNQLGAHTVIKKLDIDTAFVIENTTATDLPGVTLDKHITKLLGGPAITVADRTHIVPEKLLRLVTDTAEANNIAYQFKKPVYGGTNSPAFTKMGNGFPVCVIAVPCRYIHGPVGLLKKDDLFNTITLVYHVIQAL